MAAEESLAELTSGHLDLRLTAGALEGDDATAGFEVTGPFELPEGDALPTMALTYTQISGGEKSSSTVTSTGSRAFIESDGATTELSPEQLTGLRGSDEQGHGLDGLDLESWFVEPRVEGSAVTGELDLVAAITGLARFTDTLGAEAPLGGLNLDEAAAARIAEAVDESAVSLRTADDGGFEGLEFTAVVRTDADVPPELQGGQFDFHLEVTRPNEPVTVDLPSTAQD